MIKAILLAAGQSKRLKSENKFKHNLLNIMNFDQLLESIGCPFSEHEVQGYMIGLLSQNLKNNYKTELDTYLKYSTNDTKCQETINQYTIFLLEMLTKKELMSS